MLRELFKELDAKRRDRFQVEARTDARRYAAQKARDDAREPARRSIREAIVELSIRSCFPGNPCYYQPSTWKPNTACRRDADGMPTA